MTREGILVITGIVLVILFMAIGFHVEKIKNGPEAIPSSITKGCCGRVITDPVELKVEWERIKRIQ